MTSDRADRRSGLPGSARLSALSDHSVWLNRLRRQVRDLTDSGVDVINIGIGDPDLPTEPRVVEVGRRALLDPATHRYPDDRGSPVFREAMAEHYERRWGVTVDPTTEILPSTGSQEAINTLTMSLTDAGDDVIIGDPGYGSHFSAAALAGDHAVSVPLDGERGWRPDFSAVDRDAVERASLLVLCYPNNPTGVLVGSGVFEEAVAFARDHQLILMHDFAYAEIVYDGNDSTSIFQVPGARDVAVELYSMTKGYSMAGWRLGAVVGNADLIDRYWSVKCEFDNGTFEAVQRAGAAALAPAGDASVAERVDTYRRRRDMVVAALRAGGVPVTPPPATPYIWSPVPAGFESCEAFAQYVLAQTAVAISPGWAFGEHGTGNYRISLMAPDDRLAEAADRLAGLNLA